MASFGGTEGTWKSRRWTATVLTLGGHWSMLSAMLWASTALALAEVPLTDVPADAATPAALWDEVVNTKLDTGRGFEVRNLSLQAGPARIKIDHGVFFLATTVGGRTSELVFQGKARLVLVPSDDIETGQLELFTGLERLDEEISEAVMVLASDAAVDAIAKRPEASMEEAAQLRVRAEELFTRWLERPERRLLGVESAVFRDALGDPFCAGYFAGWFRSEELGDFLYLFEPEAREQVTLGQFVPIDASDRQKKQLARGLHRAQRRGHLIGMEVEDLGQWDTWISSSRRTDDGRQQPGSLPFEPRHYELEVSLTGSKLNLAGRARIHLQALSNVARIVKLDMHADLRVRYAAADGQNLFFHQSNNETLVILPRTPERDETFVLEIHYDGAMVEKIEGKAFALRDTLGWYPHTGTTDLATYDVLLRWPAKLELVAAGQKVEAGTEDGRRFERRRLSRPTFGFSFEIGKFRTFTAKAGHVDVRLEVDSFGMQAFGKAGNEEILDTVTDALPHRGRVVSSGPSTGDTACDELPQGRRMCQSGRPGGKS